MTEEQLRNQIKSMSYKEMLRRWRYSLIGDPMFQGEVGFYFASQMNEKRDKLSHAEQVQTSKDIDEEERKK